MALDIERLFSEAKRISIERGHDPDEADLDCIVEDAIQLARSAITTEQVVAMLDTLIQNAETDSGACNICGAIQDCTPDCTSKRCK
jgi:hypothetical protein